MFAHITRNDLQFSLGHNSNLTLCVQPYVHVNQITIVTILKTRLIYLNLDSGRAVSAHFVM